MVRWRVAPSTTEKSRGMLFVDNMGFECALGQNGLTAATDKREGDGKTPLGRYPMRRVFYRADRIAPPVTDIPLGIITAQSGWCDDPDHACYNQLVTLPFNGSHEILWRSDPVYDLLVTIGHNDSPPVPGLGSAIFIHIARSGFEPTRGCIALRREDLMHALSATKNGDYIEISDRD